MNLQPNDGLIDLQGLLAALAVKSRTSYYRYAKLPNFPRAVRVNGNNGPLRFRAREVVEFLDSLDTRQ